MNVLSQCAAMTNLIKFWAILALILKTVSMSSNENPLEGKVLRIFVSEVPPYVKMKRNVTGQITEIGGSCMESLKWLSRRFGFSYVIKDLPIRKQFDNVGNQSGTINYVLQKDVDWIVGVVILTENRNKLGHLPYPMTINYATPLLPYPTPQANIMAPLEPFSTKVWTLVIVTLVTTSLTMKILSSVHNAMMKVYHLNIGTHEYYNLLRSIDYVLTVFLSQGGACMSNRLFIRLIAASWCLAAFVLVNAYSCTLTSFVSAPNRELLVKSLLEVPEKPHVNLVVTKGKGADLIISNSESEWRKKLRKILDRDSSNRCPTIDKCLEMVRLGSSVFVDANPVVMELINKDLRKRGECHYTTTNERLSIVPASFLLPKNNNYAEQINKGIITMWDTGMMNLWERETVPVPTICLNYKSATAKNPQLGLRNLIGPFIILVCGYALSFILFISECLLVSSHL